MSLDPDRLSADTGLNRQSWNTSSDGYQANHHEDLLRHGSRAWGVWRVPESELRVLGDLAGKDVLELGCGAAQWSIALAKLGAFPVALDLSDRQLEHARDAMAQAGVDFPLINASAESVPLPSGSFDVVFSDWGATHFADPDLVVPEVARLLRPGGLFAFCGSTPFVEAARRSNEDEPGLHLERDYFGMRVLTDGDWVEFVLTYGDWVRLFRRNGFSVEDLIEIRPPADAQSSYVTPEALVWARRWPYEQIWKVRKAGA